MEYGLTEGYMSVNVVTFDSQPVNQESRSSSFHERLIRYNCEDIIVGQIFYNENQRDHKSEKNCQIKFKTIHEYYGYLLTCCKKFLAMITSCFVGQKSLPMTNGCIKFFFSFLQCIWLFDEPCFLQCPLTVTNFLK